MNNSEIPLFVSAENTQSSERHDYDPNAPLFATIFISVNVRLLAHVFTSEDPQLQWLKREESYWEYTGFIFTLFLNLNGPCPVFTLDFMGQTFPLPLTVMQSKGHTFKNFHAS